MKSQANIVGYILLVAAIVGIAFGVYFWGRPILEKSQAREYASSLESSFEQIAKLLSETAQKRITTTYPISFSRAHIVLSYDQIEATVDVPYVIYSTQIQEIPINTEYLFECNDNEVPIGTKKTICNDQTLIVNVTNTEIILNDTFHKKVIRLPLKNYKGIIFGKYVFNIMVSGNNVYFIPTEIIGVKGLDPDCIVTATARTDINEQIVQYKIKCRVMYDYDTKLCYKIQIIPQGVTEYNGESSATLMMSYESSEYKNVSSISTLCNNMEIKKVKVSFT